MYKENAKQLLNFIDKSPTCFHVIKNMKTELLQSGFEELKENEIWKIKQGGKYFVTRNLSSIIAFRIPKGNFKGFNIMTSHSDSPSFKIKENPEMDVDKKYTKLNVEGYGGMLCAPWFDRPLSIAGRVIVQDEDLSIRTILVNVDKDLVMIPNIAIHMNRNANDGYKYNEQIDLLPLLGSGDVKNSFATIIAEAAGVPEKNIIGSDLFLYNREKGTIWGVDEEFISCSRLDDLECAYASLQGILHSENNQSIAVHCVLDNEEVGSGTKQGAASTFLKDTLLRINQALGKTEEQYRMALAESFMISADNAHAVHPNKTEKSDPTNRSYLNDGIVIKHSANQKYTTDAVSCAIMKILCKKADIPFQMFANRSDMSGGSTLGNISNTQVALNTVDIGVAQLAMHSPYETAGVKDVTYLINIAKTFFNSTISTTSDGNYIIK